LGGVLFLYIEGFFNGVQIAGTRILRREYSGHRLAGVIALESIFGQLTAAILYFAVYSISKQILPATGMLWAAYAYVAVAGLFSLAAFFRREQAMVTALPPQFRLKTS
jgi:hypothetical protein